MYMNKWTPEEKKKTLNISCFLFFIRDYRWKIKWEQQWSSPYFFPHPFTSSEHISSIKPSPPPQTCPPFDNHPTLSIIPLSSRGYPVFLCARGAPLKISPPKAPPPTTAVVLCLDVEQFTQTWLYSRVSRWLRRPERGRRDWRQIKYCKQHCETYFSKIKMYFRYSRGLGYLCCSSRRFSGIERGLNKWQVDYIIISLYLYMEYWFKMSIDYKWCGINERNVSRVICNSLLLSWTIFSTDRYTHILKKNIKKIEKTTPHSYSCSIFIYVYVYI